jgi:PTS system nitrogen regulatory IIA component
MQIDVKEAARLLAISEKTVYRWIRQGALPAYKMNDQYRFNGSELLEWATARRINVSPDIFKGEVLASVVGLMQLPREVDRVRNPIVLHIPVPAITLCFLETPIEFDSIDGKPVHTLFTLVSPTVRAHLHLLSRLTWALRQPGFRDPVARAAGRDELLEAARGMAP